MLRPPSPGPLRPPSGWSRWMSRSNRRSPSRYSGGSTQTPSRPGRPGRRWRSRGRPNPPGSAGTRRRARRAGAPGGRAGWPSRNPTTAPTATRRGVSRGRPRRARHGLTPAALLADLGVGEVEVGRPGPAVLCELPTPADPPAVGAEGAAEALREVLAVPPQPPHAVGDAHLVDPLDAARVEVVLAEAFAGPVGADDRDAVGGLGQLHGPPLDQERPTLQPLERDLSPTRPRRTTRGRRLDPPRADEGIQPLDCRARTWLLHQDSFRGRCRIPGGQDGRRSPGSHSTTASAATTGRAPARTGARPATQRR